VKRIIIDTDAGVDDALAIILALKSPELRVEAITTVAGNAKVEKCTRNCLLLLDLLEPKHPPMVAQGAERPLVENLVTAPEVHGDDGLGSITPQYARPYTQAVYGEASDLIIDLVRAYPDKLTIVAIGPLTNLALAVEKAPKVMKKAQEIIAMGGALRVPGNTGPDAEFNMYVDPHAAQWVLDARLPLTLLPLDVTEQVILYRSEVLSLRNCGDRRIGNFIAEMTRAYMRYHEETAGFLGGYLHDPLAVGVAIRRDYVQCRDLKIAVKMGSRSQRGKTVAVPRRSKKTWQPNARVARSVKRKEFLDFFRSRVWQ
jgi:inosine-uridine nucleoside N-ribohydrolase